MPRSPFSRQSPFSRIRDYLLPNCSNDIYSLLEISLKIFDRQVQETVEDYYLWFVGYVKITFFPVSWSSESCLVPFSYHFRIFFRLQISRV